MVLGIAFAGSPARLADGVRIAGVDVGGMTPGQAKARLRQKWAALEHVPVSFRAGGDVWRLSPNQLGVRPDWGAAVDDARRQGQGFGPLRGFRRLDVRVFGADVAPPTSVYDTALQYVKLLGVALEARPFVGFDLLLPVGGGKHGRRLVNWRPNGENIRRATRLASFHHSRHRPFSGRAATT